MKDVSYSSGMALCSFCMNDIEMPRESFAILSSRILSCSNVGLSFIPIGNFMACATFEEQSVFLQEMVKEQMNCCHVTHYMRSRSTSEGRDLLGACQTLA